VASRTPFLPEWVDEVGRVPGSLRGGDSDRCQAGGPAASRTALATAAGTAGSNTDGTT
jgi:hypothetical protein